MAMMLRKIKQLKFYTGINILFISFGNILFNDTLHTFLFTIIWCWTYGKDHSDRKRKPAASTSSTRHPRQGSSNKSFCYTSCGALTGMRNISKGSPGGIDLMNHQTMSRHSTTELHPAHLYILNTIKNSTKINSNGFHFLNKNYSSPIG